MIPTGVTGGLENDPESLTSTTMSYRNKGNENSVLNKSKSRKGLLCDDSSWRGIQDMLTINLDTFRSPHPNASLSSPFAKFRQITEGRDDENHEISCSLPSSPVQGFRRRFKKYVSQRIGWVSIKTMFIQWIKKPLNMALLLWLSCVGISGAILFLVMTGMLDSILPEKSQRDAWFEFNNQILNALFTLMCLYQHPKRFHQLVLLCRWKPKDMSFLRKVYCKNGTCKPNEWIHMMVVVVLLHVNCFAQYALCALNLRYKRSKRPAAGVGLCLSIAIAAPAIAGLYSIISPLGKEYEADEAVQHEVPMNENGGSVHWRFSIEKRFSFALKNEERFVQYAPEWKGGLFDVLEDVSAAYLSLFCSFCVFGWNMERLGFGNMYVHIATFLLFCTAPFWIFNLAAVNIENEIIREALGLTGIVLCVFGLLYGGFWRIQMRKRFNLPANNFCCGKPAIADCMQWIFCCCCSLAQEVRTADFYEIVEDKFSATRYQPAMPQLRREDGASELRFMATSPPWINSSELAMLRS